MLMLLLPKLLLIGYVPQQLYYAYVISHDSMVMCYALIIKLLFMCYVQKHKFMFIAYAPKFLTFVYWLWRLARK